MSKSKKKPKGKAAEAWRLLSNSIIAVIACFNIAVALLLMTCGLCTFISPSTAPRLGLFCLFYPILVAANLAFIPVWLLTRWRLVAIPIVAALLSSFFTYSYCPINFPSDTVDSCHTLRLMTFNSKMFYGLTDKGADSTHTFLQMLRRDNYDIIAFQEGDLTGRKREIMMSAAHDAGYNIMQAEGTSSNFVFTRFTPLYSEKLSMPTSASNHSFAFHIKCGDDTITLVNAHLESYCLEEPVKDRYREMLHQLDPDSTHDTGRHMMHLMQPKMKMHGEQIDSLLCYIEPLLQQGRTVVLCGDFNDTPVSYACRRARSVLTDAYRAAGCGPGFTYHEKAMPFRIDHIFTSERLKPVKTWVETTVLESDHYPLATILELLPKKAARKE